MYQITKIPLERWAIPQIDEFIKMKLAKGDIQAELDLNNEITKASIRLDLKQLFICMQAMIKVPGDLYLEERRWASDKSNPFARQLFIMRDNIVIKDLTRLGITQQDIQIRKDVELIDHNWKKE